MSFIVKQHHTPNFRLFICFNLFLLFSGYICAKPVWPEVQLQKSLNTANLPVVKVSIDKDPVYQTQKQYRAFPLKPILKTLSAGYPEDKNKAVLVFTAKDGYKVAMAYSDAISESGYLAFADLGAKQGQWNKFKFGQEHMTPAPYYLVWNKPGIDKWRYPWPFQLTSIMMQPAAVYFGSAAPVSADENINEGFAAFSRYCIRCHAVNGQGGNLGPELNNPVNVTDLYDDHTLKNLILNNPDLRPNSKMPAFESLLSSTQIEQILAYLTAMRQHPAGK